MFSGQRDARAVANRCASTDQKQMGSQKLVESQRLIESQRLMENQRLVESQMLVGSQRLVEVRDWCGVTCAPVPYSGARAHLHSAVL